jgi:dihydroxy-acid dehydratase
MQGGTIAVVNEGDIIAIDIPVKKITLKVAEDEIQKRLEKWTAPEPKITKGYMSRYAKMVSSANTGAIFK